MSNCGCGCKNCGCNQEKCSCSCHCQQEECSHVEHNLSTEAKASYFLEVADEAWEEVLKDKIKEHILKTQNERMTKLAKIVAEGNNQRWRNRMEKKQGCNDFMEELCDFFSHAKK